MFKYEYEKRPSRSESRTPIASEWSRGGPSASRVQPSAERARRPLPPRPVSDRIPTKPTVPLRVWVVAGASCLAVSAALVVATLAVTRWTTAEYTTQIYSPPDQIYAKHPPTSAVSEEIDNEIADLAILQKLSLFKNIVANRDRTKDLLTKPQIHPIHDPIHHPDRKIEKKDRAELPESLKTIDFGAIPPEEINKKVKEFNLPEFKPLLPAKDLKLPDSYVNNLSNKDYEEYYNDVNLYDDYMESNTMISYLIEKVQELHDWITTDSDFDKNTNATAKLNTKTEFSQLLKALNESLLEGNVSIVMNKLKDIYFGDNYTFGNNSRRIILTNGTDLVSFGILTLDVMLLHNIQVMAWESQEGARSKMMKDPDVYAFNALFMEPSKVEAMLTHNGNTGRGRDVPNLFEYALEGAMGAARAALHLGRAYKNARNLLTQLHEPIPAASPALPRHADNAHALSHLQSFTDSDSDTQTSGVLAKYSELDCVWLLYCRNLALTARLPAPYGTMARINGMGLRMVAGALSADRALDALVYEALTGWTPLDCNNMLPKCSKVDAASVVLQAILQPQKKITNRGR